ncbi:helix-turn-helix domain-containing protein [Scandinavium sp. TWS1a]|uniref:helix-turn-helix domain-containing protein n=1 Tax=Scandinavium tedordense TaxID=2926521 RepID=UPI001357AE70|nr:helix-turn-helix domain-containing protein [Scandinavium tedordense]MCS2169864.1 helix-turn-helix domain-containing protein [Scandinavium tedordense]
MLAVKPLSAFNALDQLFSPNASTFILSSQDTLSLNCNASVVTVFRQGTCKIARTKEDILVAICPSPMILGLAGLLDTRRESYQLTALTHCEAYQLEASQCRQLLDQHQLWREAFHWVSWIARAQEARDVQLIGKNSYSQIRATLQVMSGWDDSLRTRIGVMNYIQQRTHISRSVIAEVLAALRAGNYIEMNKGKLVSIHRLPLEY